MESFACMLLVLAAPQLPAQPSLTVIASPSADTALTQDPLCRDEELLRLGHGEPWARLYLPLGGWYAILGDADLDGNFDAPPGVDGLAFAPESDGAEPSLLDFWFSTDSDFQGWRDGDVLRVLAGGALQRVYAEDEIRTALGTTSAFDLDAIARDAQGRLCFSLRDGLAASALGAVEDGDVLLYDPAQGTAARFATESEVQAWVDRALPGSGAVGDVKGLDFDPRSGELLFTIQSPSDQDATLFSAAQGGMLYEGFAEADFGFAQAAELDAIAVAAAPLPQPPVIVADLSLAAPGQSFTIRVRHAPPYAVLRGIVTSRRAVLPSVRGGFGLAVADIHSAGRGWPLPGGDLVADSSGSASTLFTAPPLPAGALQLDLFFQLWDGGAGGLSTPWAVRVQ